MTPDIESAVRDFSPLHPKREARRLIAALANKHRNSDLRADHPDVVGLIDEILFRAATLQAKVNSILGILQGESASRDEKSPLCVHISAASSHDHLHLCGRPAVVCHGDRAYCAEHEVLYR